MRITQLGHASLYVETANVRLLIDPVLIDPHQEGFLEVFPRRAVHWEHLPPFEMLFVSHRHLDHFDIATLARLPREVQVIIPDDPLIAEAFDSLGFDAVRRVHDFFAFRIEETFFLITPSQASIAEHGILVSDPDGVFWNQVDTVLSAEQIDLVLGRAPSIDLLFAPWQPMLEQAWQHNEPLSFPYDEYARLLQAVGRVRPRALVPGANGFRYTGSAEWMNHVVFPQSRERFMTDALMMLPSLGGNIYAADPGDVLELRAGETTLHRRASQFVTSGERDFAAIEFHPATAQRPLRDYSGATEEETRARVEEFVERVFPSFVREHAAMFRNHREWRVIYQLEIAGAEESAHWWCDFGEAEVVLRRGRNALANLFCGITATSLSGLMGGLCGWDRAAFGGDFYQHHRIYGVWERGVVFPHGVSIVNPLYLIFAGEEVLAALLRKQLSEAHRGAQVSEELRA